MSVVMFSLVPDAMSQRLKPLFGPRIDFNPGFPVVSVASARLPGEEAQTLLLSPAKRNEIQLYTIGRTGKPQRSGAWSTPAPISSVIWQESPRGVQFALFSTDPPGVQISRISSTTTGFSVTAPPDADRVAFADITNDKLTDLLFFGKRSAGITMNRGTPDGFSASGTSILPDLSASDLVATDLNGDMIIDLFVADWLSNKLVLYLGIGRGVFSEQVSVFLSGEPSRLAFSQEKGGKNRVAVTLPDLKQIQVFTINPLGEFTTESFLSCPGTPGRLVFSDVSGDGTAELVTATEEELVVFILQKGKYHREPYLFAAGGRISDWTMTDLDNDDLLDAVIVTNDPPRVVLLGNSGYSGTISWPAVYSVGPAPRGLATGDFNGDGMQDVAVVSSDPGKLSLLINRGEGRMEGPVFTQVGDNPVSVRYVRGGQEHLPAFILSHYPSTHVTVVRATDTSPLASFEIPTASNPFVLFAAIDPSRKKLSFLTRNRGDQKQNLSLSLFDEISDEQFIETNLRPNPPRRVTSITAFDMTGDGQDDLVFSSIEKNLGLSTISLSRGVDRFSFAPHAQIFSFPDSVGTVRFIRAAYLDNDRYADIAVVLNPPNSSMLLLYGKEGGVRDYVEWIHDVEIPGEDALITEDLNNDGKMDLCFVDAKMESVIALFGSGDGTFRERKTIFTGAGVVALSSGSFTGPGVTDLWLSNQKNGTITLLRNPF